MQLSDFVKYFDNLDICHLSADAMDKDKEGVPFGWNVNCFHGRWIHGQTAGGQPTSQPHGKAVGWIAGRWWWGWEHKARGLSLTTVCV